MSVFKMKALPWILLGVLIGAVILVGLYVAWRSLAGPSWGGW